MIASPSPCRRKYQTGMALSAEKQATEDVDGTGPVGGLFDLDAFLHSIERGLIHQRLMGILHSNPFFLRPRDMPFVFEDTVSSTMQIIGLPVRMAILNIRPCLKNTSDSSK